MNIRAKLQMRNTRKNRIDLSGALNVIKPSESVSELLRKYATSNVLKLFWMFVLGSGGMLFLFYYWWLEYFPVSFDLASSSALLAAISITGLGLFVALSIYTILPGWFWRETVCEEKKLTSVLQPENPKQFQISTGLFFTAPIVIALGFALVYFVSDWRVYWLVPVTMSCILLVGWFLKLKNQKSLLPSIILLIYVAINCTIFVGLIFFMAWIFSWKNNADYAAAFLAVLLVLIITNHIAATLGNKRTWWIYVLLAVILVVVTSFITKNFFQTSKATMRLLKFGNIENAQLILDTQGGQIARQFIDPIASSVSAASSVPSTKEDPKINTEDKKDRFALSEGCLVRSITILSRLGNEYYLEVKLPDNQKGAEDNQKRSVEHRFNIPASHVLSWRVHEDDKGKPTSLECAEKEVNRPHPVAKNKVLSQPSKVVCVSVCCKARIDNKICPSVTGGGAD